MHIDPQRRAREPRVRASSACWRRALAAMLAGCYTPSSDGASTRLRAIIASAIRSRSRKASGPSSCSSAPARRPDAAQRADVARLRAAWRREVDRRHHHRRAGRHAPTNAPPPRRCAKSQSILAASGVPANAGARAALSAGRARSSRTLKLSYPKMVAEAGPCGLWPDDLGADRRPEHNRERPVLESRLRHAAQSRRHGGEPGRPGPAARRNAAPTPRRRTTVLEKYRKRRDRPRPTTRTRTKARSATWQMIKVKRSQAHAKAPHRADAGARRAYRAGAARLGAGLLRDGRDRRRRAGGRRGPAPGQGPSQDPDGRHRRRRRGLRHVADAQRHRDRVGRAAATISSPASIRSPRSATPARAWS